MGSSKYDSTILRPGTLPSSGEDGELRVDSDDSNKLKKWSESASAWQEISGSGGGSGGINWVNEASSKFEDGTGDWETFAEGTYTDGTGGTASVISLSQTTTASEVQNGDGSLKISKSASDGSGEGASILTDTIGDGYRGRTHYLRFLWKPDSNYTSEDLKLRAYGVDSDAGGNSEIIPVIPVSGALEDSNGLAALPDYKTEIVCKVLPTENHDKVRLSAYLPSDSTTGTAWDNIVDDFKLSPDQVVPGAILTKWQEFTISIDAATTAPTKGTIVRDKAWWRRVGENMEIRYEYEQSAGGSNGSGDYLFSLPSGYQVSSSLLTASGASNQTNTVGSGVGSNTSSGLGNTTRLCNINVYDSTNVVMSTDSGSTQSFVGSGVFGLVGVALYAFHATIPIEGWSAGAQRSTTENAFKNASVRAAGNGGESITAGTTDIPFTEIDDPFNLWDGSKFTVKESGFYIAIGATHETTSSTGALEAYIDGVQDKRISINDNTNLRTFQWADYLQAGEEFSIRRTSNNVTLNDNSTFHWLTILSWHDLSAFSVTGEWDYDEAEKSSNESITATSYQSSSGMNITVPPGTHFIGMDLDVNTRRTDSNAGQAQAFYQLYDSTNGVELREREIRGYDDNPGLLLTSIYSTKKVIITETTTYEVRVKAGPDSEANMHQGSVIWFERKQ